MKSMGKQKQMKASEKHVKSAGKAYEEHRKGNGKALEKYGKAWKV